ncbi:MAG: hypothetical protein J6D31_06470 [Clostridia bacterium]|nr:hypothetical protein [Clostridia bacterium]
MERLQIDFTTEIGKIKPMHATNNGPAGSAVRNTGIDAAFAAAGIPYARNHDAAFYSGYGGENTVDVHRIFRNFAADENDPASYDFRATDQYVQRTEACGTHVFYRLGAAIEHDIKRGTFPPADYLKWARICAHIIRHYNEGWANGFRYGIAYWEIWNEPDCRNGDGSNPCWQGTDEEFVEFFCTVLSYLKGQFPYLKIGGPAFCWGWGGEERLPHKLLAAMQKRGLTMDFYSFHCYAHDPEQIRINTEEVDKLLAKYGFAGMETNLNEWNYNCGWNGEDFIRGIEIIKGQKGASYTTACMCVGQASSLGMLMYYDARPSAYNGLFDTDTLRILHGYYPFKMFGSLYRLGASAAISALPKGLYAAAATNGQKHALLLTRFDDAAAQGTAGGAITLALGLPAGKTYRVKQYLLDEENTMAEEEIPLSPDGSVVVSCPMYTVLYLEIEEA